MNSQAELLYLYYLLKTAKKGADKKSDDKEGEAVIGSTSLMRITGFEPATSAFRTNIAMCYVVFFYFRLYYGVMFILLLDTHPQISHFIGKMEQKQSKYKRM